ncbi:signal peptide peptidase SppA [Niabella drilacis]|uniref:Protease-4 n=1 Tax=Niabella drilacis (strain DSM 25811 / CCM 8410 / CCUG 62505 / LMG 26954 / E90) TaxID=1285928 RepID=A0A1G6L0E2_NIADE|nr:signal peptide peptidase SppA [Niabella drilacis]SDC36829.1 protease-4 [Niabella drilacis]
MRSFFKIFLASFLAILVFCAVAFFFFMGMAGSAVSSAIPVISDKSVLKIDLGEAYVELPSSDIQSMVQEKSLAETPSLYDVLRLIKKAKTDDRIKAIYLVANGNANGFASSDEIRTALADFKGSGKEIIAFGNTMTQKAYSVANIANKVYVSPSGDFEWVGYRVSYLFLKGALDKLQINPQIFYAGKFKSATEPLRAEKMTEANQLQTRAWLNDLYADLLQKTAVARKLDTALLHQWANEGVVVTPQIAAARNLIDGVRYDDELQAELKRRLKIDSTGRINFVTVGQYAQVNKDLGGSGEKIALIYAAGNIVDGKEEEGVISDGAYVELLRKARLDQSIKAIVVRVNSGGGSALASDHIWREMKMAKAVKPLVVSFGDVAASGGYYMSCAADSIFALPGTLTGSIGVFGVIPDMSAFLKNKLGVTFDGVSTGPLANAGSIDHPMTEQERKIVQGSIERIYEQFKQRVAEGRKRDTAYIETIAQGRVWTGLRAKEIGLIDRYGGLQDAIDAAAKKAGLKEFSVKEYPRYGSLLERILGLNKSNSSETMVKQELGPEYARVYQQLRSVKQMINSIQARLPFEFFVQ